MRYYVDNSSYFDSHLYNRPKIAKAVKSAGGKDIRLSYKWGRRNQPKVVTFGASETTARKVGYAVEKALGTNYIHILAKSW